MTQDPNSIIFHAVCNEAVDVSMRPIRQRVIYRLAERFRRDVFNEHTNTRASELSDLFAGIWDQAQYDVPHQPASPGREKHVESRFVELIGKDPQWRALVLVSLVQERRWSDLCNRGYEYFVDRFSALLEKLASPHHPVARATTSVLTGIATALLAIWLPPTIANDPNLYKKMLIPLRNAIQVNNDINLKSSVQVDGDSVIHLKAVVDDKDLSAVIKPVVKPDVLSMTLNPSVDASLKITPHIQYSPVNSDDLNKSAAEPQGLPVHFVPAGDLSLFSKGLWDPNSTLKVSVQELNPQSEPQSKSQQSLSPQNATPTPNALTSDSVRPLDKIGDNLSTLSSLYKILGVLGNELQAPNGDSQSNLATLQQSQNLIHSTATNQDRTTVIEVRPNSVHSVVLQWFAAPAVPESCTLTFKVEEVNADKIHLSGITQKCSSQTSVIRNLPDNLVLGPGDPHNLGQWILSVDETRRRWAFLHAATLRFTWQPTYTNNGSTAQILRTSP